LCIIDKLLTNKKADSIKEPAPTCHSSICNVFYLSSLIVISYTVFVAKGYNSCLSCVGWRSDATNPGVKSIEASQALNKFKNISLQKF